nr:MAG TPA: hypothetical protein [Caudoviricetes sp.]
MPFSSRRANRRLQEMSVLQNEAGPGKSGGNSQFNGVVLLRCRRRGACRSRPDRQPEHPHFSTAKGNRWAAEGGTVGP